MLLIKLSGPQKNLSVGFRNEEEGLRDSSNQNRGFRFTAHPDVDWGSWDIV